MPLKDPICGMAVTDKSFYHLEHEGVRHYFCGNKCKARFATRMGHFAGEAAAKLATDSGQAPMRKLHWAWWLLLAGLVALGVVIAALA
jgi:Cu+-exporting ATPase